jgi:hypothetical protein
MYATTQRDKALAILNAHLTALRTLYKACFLALGKGGLLIYAEDVIKGSLPGKESYRTRAEMLEVFDEPDSQSRLAKLLDSYDPRKEGIMTLITADANATFFVTWKL